MGQKFYKFRAETLELAHRAMRKKLGEDAIVLRTTTVSEGGLMGMMGKRLYEITASAPSTNPVARQLSAVERKYLTSGVSDDADDFIPLGKPVSEGERRNARETVAYFEQLVRDAQERMGTSPAQSANAPSKSAEANPASESTEPAKSKPSDPDTIRNDLGKIREMLQVLFAEMPGTGLPVDFVPHYRQLTERGVTRELAADLVTAASKCDDDSLLRDEKVFRERMKLQIRSRVRTTDGISLTGHRHVVALVGPTGVGKTTNLAKLAALFAVTEKAKVGLITADTYRVAATDHLRVYANIIGLGMKVVKSARQAAAALQTFEDCSLVLMDTAGGSPFNEEQMGDVQGILEGAAPDETMLLVSAATPLEDMQIILERFACLKPTSILFTKLDETQRYGALLSMAASAGLPLSYFSIGQNVPDDIVRAHAGMVADLALEDRERGRASTKTA